MSLSDRSLASQAFKLSQRLSHTANNRDFYNEGEESSYVVFAKDIWANNIDPDPTVSESAGIVTNVTLRLQNVFTAGQANPNSYLTMFYWDEQSAATQTALAGKINPRTGTLYSATAGETAGNGNGQRVGHIIPYVLNEFKATEGGYKPVITKSDQVTTIASGHPSDWFLDTFAGVVVHEIDSSSDFMILNGGGDELAKMECFIYTGLFLTEALGISGSGGGSGVPSNVTDLIDALQTQVDSINVQVTAISGDVTTLEQNFNLLETNVETISADLDALEVTVGGIQTDVSQVTTDVSGISGDVNTLQGQFSTVDTNVTNLSASLVNYPTLAGENTFTGDSTIFTGDVTVQGTFTTAGSAFIVDAQNATVTGALLTLNKGEVGSGVTQGEAGIIIDRGTAVDGDYKIVYDENRDSLVIGLSGETDIVATRTTDPVQGGVLVIGDSDGKNFKQDSSIAWDGETLNVAGGLTLSESGSGANSVVTRDEVESMIGTLGVGDVTSAQLSAISASLDSRIDVLENSESLTQSDIVGITAALDDRITDLEDGITSIVGASGNVIGPAEDGTYEDGLFTEFTTTTPVGHAIDKINEILKAIAPPSPDAFASISFTTGAGENGNLSFGPTNLVLSDYEEVPSKGVGSAFTTTGTEKGIYPYSGNVTGVLNPGSADPNGAFPANSFADGDKGTLELWVNGSQIGAVDVDLSTHTVGVDGASIVNANGTGFISISDATAITLEGNGGSVEIDAIKYRTAQWRVNYQDWRKGYNVVYVVHRVDGTPRTSNVYEFVLDDDTTPLSFTGGSLGTPSMGTSKWLSGVQYYTGGNISYTVTVNNAYRNTYVNATDPFSVGGTNVSQQNIVLEGIGGSDHTKTFVINTTMVIYASSSQRLFNEDVGVAVSAKRTVQADAISTPELNSGEKFLIDAVGQTSDDLNEYFDDETYRMYAVDSLANTNYGGPSSPSSDYEWVSTHALDALPVGYDGGLLVFNGKLRYPNNTDDGISNGNFTAITQPNLSTLDYSGITGVKYYYRYFYLGDNIQNFGIRVLQDGVNFITSAASFSASSHTKMEILAPNTTTNSGGTPEWKDAYRNYEGVSDIGMFQENLQSKLPSAQYRGYTLGSKSTTSSGGVILVKFTVPSLWSGTIDSISVFKVTT
jgi:hypothetical protein